MNAPPPDPHAFRPAAFAAWVGGLCGSAAPPAALFLSQLAGLDGGFLGRGVWGFAFAAAVVSVGAAVPAGLVGHAAANRLRDRWGRRWREPAGAFVGGFLAGTAGVLAALIVCGCAGLLPL